MMVNEKTKENCCGCRACENICPHMAIAMVEDEKGFRYPQIEEMLCNNCGLCDIACGFVDNYKNYGDNPTILAIKHKNDEIRKTSTSGGMFVAISDEILKLNGVIYGAGYDDQFNVVHKRAETKVQRDEFKGSKYVQSNLGRCFFQIREDLKKKKTVLFTGTPCQVSSLNSFLGKNYNNLVTVDILCHGTPSNKLWQEYLRIIENINKSKVVKVYFRDKTDGWHRSKPRIILNNQKLKKVKGEQAFFQLFLPNYMLMPACHNCKFRNFNRPGDITLADFWGIEKYMPEFDDNKGVSLVMVNSPKGMEVINTLRDKLEILPGKKEHCALDQIIMPVPKNKRSDQFWIEYHKFGLKFVMVKYTDYSDVITFFRKVIGRITRITQRIHPTFHIMG